MRRTLIASSVVLAGLFAPAAAGASVVDAYQRLAARNLKPAPLVPTTVPSTLAPADRTITNGTTRGARGYSIRIVHVGRNGPDAVIALSGGEFKTMRALLRDQRRLGFRGRRPMRVRGHRGYLLTRRLGPLNRTLAWKEGGVVYWMGSGTPKKVSLAQLRATARGLDRLERDWIGDSGDPDSGAYGFAVTTARTVSVDIQFEASCAAPGSTFTTLRAGQTGVTLMKRDGDRFAFDIAEHRKGSGAWEGTVTGTISRSAITLDVQPRGTIDGDVCSGAQTLTLDRRVR